MRLFRLCFALVVCSNIAHGQLQQPNAKSFTTLNRGEITVTEYTQTKTGRTGYGGSNAANNVSIRSGDMSLTEKQVEFLFEPNDRSGYKAEIDERKRWTNGVVPYTIDAVHFNVNQTEELHRAMRTLSDLTCLIFRPKVEGDRNWVKYTDNGSGCNSQVGMMDRGEQSVNLGINCKWRGLYFHEIGHALGLIHEHQRPDRDDHVKVIWRRVKTFYLSAFTKYKNEAVNDFGIEYDYSSIMHYEPDSFNDAHELTTLPHDEWKVELLFRVYYKTLSFTDTKVLNAMYQCDKSCGRSPRCPSNSYRDRHCNCVTPKDIHDALCINERPDEECYERVRKGECDETWTAAEMHITCRKACGSCPTYGMRDYVEPRLSRAYDACADRYHDVSYCQKWARDGDCETYPWWMKRNCRRSCRACRDVDQGRCRNYFVGAVNDRLCDANAAVNLCSVHDNIKAGCQGSCRSCGFQIPGKCDDSSPDCSARTLQGQCDHSDPIRAAATQSQCRKSCNSCSMNQGRCANELSDRECSIAASLGLCRIEPRKYKKQCQKACDSCGYGVKDASCRDIYPEQPCAQYAEAGTCKENKNYAYRFCASSCNVCDWARNPPCEDFDERCEAWVNRGECVSNYQSMSTTCAKSCGTCDRYRLDACFNVESDALCEVQKGHGDCEQKRSLMAKNCRRSCGLCRAPPIARTWECRDLSQSCSNWHSRGECERNPIYMEAYCHNTCGHCRRG